MSGTKQEVKVDTEVKLSCNSGSHGGNPAPDYENDRDPVYGPGDSEVWRPTFNDVRKGGDCRCDMWNDVGRSGLSTATEMIVQGKLEVKVQL